MKNTAFFILLLLFCFFSTGIFAGQATNVVLYSYTFTWEKIEISADGGNTWVTVFTGPQSYTLLDTAPIDSKIADIWTNVEIPVGTYNYIRATFASQDTAKYQFDYGGQTWYTTTGGFTNNVAEFDYLTWTRGSTVTSVPLNPPIEFTNDQHRSLHEFFNLNSTTVSIDDVTLEVSINIPYTLETT